MAKQSKSKLCKSLPPYQPESSTNEKRQFQRVELKTKVNFQSNNNFYEGLSQDISEGGIFIETSEILELGTQVDLCLDLPDGQRIEVLGEVRWVREGNDVDSKFGSGMGIHFSELDEGNLEIIRYFILQREPLIYHG